MESSNIKSSLLLPLDGNSPNCRQYPHPLHRKFIPLQPVAQMPSRNLSRIYFGDLHGLHGNTAQNIKPLLRIRCVNIPTCSQSAKRRLLPTLTTPSHSIADAVSVAPFMPVSLHNCPQPIGGFDHASTTPTRRYSGFAGGYMITLTGADASANVAYERTDGRTATETTGHIPKPSPSSAVAPTCTGTEKMRRQVLPTRQPEPQARSARWRGSRFSSTQH
jgi:hypothetical protein